MPRGGYRHGGFDPDKAEVILLRLSEGETLRSICRDAGMPTYRTVGNWRKADPEFDKMYRDAQLDGCYSRNDETIEIADNLQEEAASRKVRIWARHELNKRARPDLFSDRQQLEHSGPNGSPITVAAVQLTDDELATIAAGSGARTAGTP